MQGENPIITQQIEQSSGSGSAAPGASEHNPGPSNAYEDDLEVLSHDFLDLHKAYCISLLGCVLVTISVSAACCPGPFCCVNCSYAGDPDSGYPF